MNNKHTPTPWHFDSIHPDNGRIQIGSPKDYICEIYPSPNDEANADINIIES